MPTQDEAVEMYARFLAARHGKAASQYARKNAAKFLAKGDFAGHAIWTRVAGAVERGSENSANLEGVMALS